MSNAVARVSRETFAIEEPPIPRTHIFANETVGRSANPIVRPLVEDDLESVARLFLKRFRKADVTKQGRDSVADYMKRIYFNAPGGGGESDSLVQINARGEVGAFVGVMRVPFLLDGSPILAGATGALMSEPDVDNGLAAVQLLRALRRGPFDLIYTDTANRTTLALCQAMKYRVLTPESLEWAFAFQPAAVAVHKVAQRLRYFPAALARPFARAADLAISRALSASSEPQKPSSWRDREIDAETFCEWAPQFLRDFRLRPEWAPADMIWLTSLAQERESAGPLHFRLVSDSSGKPLGAYAFYGERGGVARVLHASALQHGWGALINRMLDTTRSLGCIGVHGAARREMMAHAYAFRGMVFYYAMGTMVHSPRADVWTAIENGSAFVGGLGGDRWTRLASDKFG